MTQVEKNSIKPPDIAANGDRLVLSGGGGSPPPNTPEGWLEMVNGFQAEALKSRLGIPLIYGVDAVHGHGNVDGRDHLPAAHRAGRYGRRRPGASASAGPRPRRSPRPASAGTSRRWWPCRRTSAGAAPTRATARTPDWCRSSARPTCAACRRRLATARSWRTPKHYLADGGTAWGTSTTKQGVQYMLDQGDARMDEATLRARAPAALPGRARRGRAERHGLLQQLERHQDARQPAVGDRRAQGRAGVQGLCRLRLGRGSTRSPATTTATSSQPSTPGWT